MLEVGITRRARGGMFEGQEAVDGADGAAGGEATLLGVEAHPGVDQHEGEADLADGVLTLRIPVSEKAQPRKISVGTRRESIDVESAAS